MFFAATFLNSLLYLLARAAITKYHRLVGLNKTHLFLPVVEAGKSKVKVPPNSVSGENLLPGSQTTAFSLFPQRGKTE